MDTSENCDIIVEEIDSCDIPEEELNDFTEAIPIKLEEILPPANVEQQTEEELITKYMNGEVSFPDYYTTDVPEEEHATEELFTPNEQIKFPSTSKDISITEDTKPQKKERRAARKRGQLNAALQGLMGEANLCFVRGEIDMTEKICLEIIRQNPLASEPFFTLAQIYETKDPEKFLQFSTIAAHLDPGNRDQWIRIAELNIENGNLEQARVCYSKGISNLPKDYDMRLRKAELLKTMNEQRDAMNTYLRVIPLLPVEKGELCLTIAKNVAKYFHTQQKIAHALAAMQCAFNLVPNLFSVEDLNLYLELLLMNKNYSTLLTILQEHANVELITENDGDDILVVACSIPDDLIADFRVKLCVSLIHLKTFHLLRYLVNNVIEFIPVENGVDWYVDIIEALMNEGRYEEAIDLLLVIIRSNEVNAPAYIWLRHAECHRALRNYNEAIESYYEVIELAPYCFDAKFTLSALLKQQGRHREAIKALEQDMDTDTIEPRLLYERCLMLKSVGEIEQYIELGYILLSRNSIKLKSREEIQVIANNAIHFKSSNLKSITVQRQEETNSNEIESNLTIEDEFDLFKDLVDVMYNERKFGLLQKLTIALLTAKRFRSKAKELVRILVLTSFYNDDATIALNVFRDILAKNLRNNCYWNLCNIIVHNLDSSNYYRYLKRLFARQPCQSFLKIFLANYHLTAGSYKYALNIYAGIFKDTKDPLVALLISIVFCQLALQKNMLRKPTALAQANAFMKKYSDLRLSPLTRQEIYYNLGRMYHQISMFHLAMHWYDKVLELPSVIGTKGEILDLKAEAAFNIHLLYKKCGNYDMARKYLHDYIVV